MERLNYGIITLIPKLNGAKKIQEFRPIFLLQCPYKLIAKVLDNRVAVFADKLISHHQNAFIKKRNIMDGILALHEILHHTHIKKRTGIVLKLDFEKAYDKVNWDFFCLRATNLGVSAISGANGSSRSCTTGLLVSILTTPWARTSRVIKGCARETPWPPSFST